MFGLFEDAKKRAERAVKSAQHAQRNFQACSLKMRDIDAQLQRIEAQLPKHLSGDAMTSTQRSITLMERGAERSLEHLHKLEQHLNHIERGIAKGNEQRKAA